MVNISFLPEGQGHEAEGHHEEICLGHVPYVSDCPCCPIHPPSP